MPRVDVLRLALNYVSFQYSVGDAPAMRVFRINTTSFNTPLEMQLEKALELLRRKKKAFNTPLEMP